jgi:hypothetical protein
LHPIKHDVDLLTARRDAVGIPLLNGHDDWGAALSADRGGGDMLKVRSCLIDRRLRR